MADFHDLDIMSLINQRPGWEIDLPDDHDSSTEIQGDVGVIDKTHEFTVKSAKSSMEGVTISTQPYHYSTSDNSDDSCNEGEDIVNDIDDDDVDIDDDILGDSDNDDDDGDDGEAEDRESINSSSHSDNIMGHQGRDTKAGEVPGEVNAYINDFEMVQTSENENKVETDDDDSSTDRFSDVSVEDENGKVDADDRSDENEDLSNVSGDEQDDLKQSDVDENDEGDNEIEDLNNVNDDQPEESKQSDIDENGESYHEHEDFTRESDEELDDWKQIDLGDNDESDNESLSPGCVEEEDDLPQSDGRGTDVTDKLKSNYTSEEDSEPNSEDDENNEIDENDDGDINKIVIGDPTSESGGVDMEGIEEGNETRNTSLNIRDKVIETNNMEDNARVQNVEDTLNDEYSNADQGSGENSRNENGSEEKNCEHEDTADSPLGFVIGEVVGVSLEEFDRHESKESGNHDQLDDTNTVRRSSSTTQIPRINDTQTSGNDGERMDNEAKKAKMDDVEISVSHSYPRVESYHSDNYLFGNAPIKQEPLDDDDYIQEHDYYGETATLNIDTNRSFPGVPEEMGLDAGELVHYQDMFDITDMGMYKCKFCSSKLLAFKAFKAHIDKYHQKSYKCPQCDEHFSRSQDLAGHCRRHRREEEQVYNKHVKDKKDVKLKCLTKIKSKKSKVVITENGKRMYQCRFCVKKFDMSQKLANHMQWKHKKERKRELTLQAKLSGNVNVAVTELSADGAKMTIKIKSTPKDAIQRKQPVYSDTYQCRHCSKIFYKQQVMAAHVRNTHTPARQDKPETLNKPKVPQAVSKKKTKKKSRNLKRKYKEISRKRETTGHADIKLERLKTEDEVTDVKETKYQYTTVSVSSIKCKLCSKMFKKQWELKAHLNGVHAQYCCRYCPKAFYKVNKFINHSLQHLGDIRCLGEVIGCPMIRCRICKKNMPLKGSATLKHLNMHIKGKTPAGQVLDIEKQLFLECIECGKPFMSREFLLKHEMKHAAVSKMQQGNDKTRTVSDSRSRDLSTENNETTTSEVNEKLPGEKSVTITAIETEQNTAPKDNIPDSSSNQSPLKTVNVLRSGPCNDDSQKVVLCSQVIQSELICVTKIPFKCGMCEARFPNSQYLLHHMTLHMNGQYVFKIEVDKKKEELLKSMANTPNTNIPTSNPEETSPASTGKQMASSIVSQLSKGSNMGSIMNSNIAPTNFHTTTDHNYTLKTVKPSTPLAKFSSRPPIIATQEIRAAELKKRILVLGKTHKKEENGDASFEATKCKLQQLLAKREQSQAQVEKTQTSVLKLPSLGVMGTTTTSLPQGSFSRPRVRRLSLHDDVEKKIRELLDSNKPVGMRSSDADIATNTVGIQTNYRSIMRRKRITTPSAEDGSNTKEIQTVQNAETSTSTIEGQDISSTKNDVLSSDMCIQTEEEDEGRTEITRKSSTHPPKYAEYSDTETLSADSVTPGSESPVVGLSSDSDSDILSEDEKELFEQVEVKYPVPVKRLSVDTSSEIKEERKTSQHSPTGHDATIKNYKKKLDFAQGTWFECELCMHLCKTYGEYQTHLQSHKKLKQKKLVKCSVCGRKFISKWHLSKHMESHRSNAYSCSKCGALFRTSSLVMKHMQTSCSS